MVKTSQGKLRAVLVTRRPELGLPPVEVFLGIQYASTLGAELRFMPPTASMEKWDGVRVALKHRPVCPQRLPDSNPPLSTDTSSSHRNHLRHLRRLLPFVEKQSEDCLNLNIFVPLPGTHFCLSHYTPVFRRIAELAPDRCIPVLFVRNCSNDRFHSRIFANTKSVIV